MNTEAHITKTTSHTHIQPLYTLPHLTHDLSPGRGQPRMHFSVSFVFEGGRVEVYCW